MDVVKHDDDGMMALASLCCLLFISYILAHHTTYGFSLLLLLLLCCPSFYRSHHKHAPTPTLVFLLASCAVGLGPRPGLAWPGLVLLGRCPMLLCRVFWMGFLSQSNNERVVESEEELAKRMLCELYTSMTAKLPHAASSWIAKDNL